MTSYDRRFIRVGDIDVPRFQRGAALISICRALWRLACAFGRLLRRLFLTSKRGTPMFGSYTTTSGPRLVWVNDRHIPHTRSRAKLRVIEGGKGKPPVPAPLLCLPRHTPPLALSAPQGQIPAPHGDRPRPVRDLPTPPPPEQWW